MTIQSFMKKEALETPAMLRREAAHWETQATTLRAQAASRPQVALIGRGSSGNACTFASYLMMLKSGRHPVEFRPWVTTQDLPEADWSDTVAYAFSASGHSVDVSEALRWLKSRGALAIGVTGSDATDLPLLEHADGVFRLNCGPEKAVPATKSFTAQLFAAAALAGYPMAQAAEQTAQAMEAIVNSDKVDTLATFLQGARTVAWLARGPSYAGALDAALKAQESLGLPAVAYSTAEFLHGPIAMFHREDRVVLFSGTDEPMDSKQAVVNTLLSRGVPFITIGTDTTREAGLPLQLPDERWARTPVLAFLAQLACAELAERMQLDADAPADLKKVTLTR
jgi:glucosamine--fructose-6-phosphate aminotransferase (isomerizing)